MTSSSETLAAWSSALEWSAIPQAQRALVALRVLDTVGLIVAGARSEAADAVFAIARKRHGAAESTLYMSGERVAAANAALAHGTLAHCRDFDDTFPDSVVHPGSIVVSAALAVGEAVQAPAEEIGAAIVIGYEAAARIGAAAGRRLHARGFHATGIVGPLSAALVAARLYRLSAPATASALGLAASMSGGLMSFVDDGSWSKWLHAGWSAHGGIVAAQLAGAGFRGPAGVLDGRHNLFSAFLQQPAPGAAALCADLDRRWAGAGAHFKYYPCAHVIQPYLDAALALRERHALEPKRIARVDCTLAPWAVPIVCEPRAAKLRPAGEVDAIASLPYQLAVALTDGRVDLEALAPACRARPEVLELAERIEHAADESLGQGFDGSMAITLQSGERIESAVAAAPADPAKLRGKFRANLRGSLGREAAGRLEDALLAAPAPRFGELPLMLTKRHGARRLQRPG